MSLTSVQRHPEGSLQQWWLERPDSDKAPGSSPGTAMAVAAKRATIAVMKCMIMVLEMLVVDVLVELGEIVVGLSECVRNGWNGLLFIYFPRLD
jgi:hypothetical protein